MSDTFEELSAERKAGQKIGIYPQWYTTQAYQMFQAKYAVTGEAGLRGRHEIIAKTLAAYMPDSKKWEAKFFEVMWNGWFSPASPVLANTGTDRGMPVSCSGQHVGDSVDSFYSNTHEAAILSKLGFGCSVDLDSVRPRGSDISVGGKASGVVPVIKDFATMAANVSQGAQRRGSVASYISIDHGDFDELLGLLETEPDGLNIGWIVSDAFIERLKNGDKEADDRFVRALYVKLVTGRGYFFFRDKANALRPAMYKDLGLTIRATNLCTEILLHSSEDYSYTCVLSSMNLATYDEWKDTDAVFTATVLLDCVVSYFIDQAKKLDLPILDKAIRFTEKGRAIGLGVMGFSSLLQQRSIPFESFEAHTLNQQIFRKLQTDSTEASRTLAGIHGEPEWCKGYGVRNTHRTAVAPTKSTALLMGGVSESVFPDPGMVFEIGSAAGGMKRISAEFYKLAKARGEYNEELVKDINQHIGSVQHLDWLSEHEKAVFRTAFEVDQEAILRLASTRQKYLCQGQSLNFFVSEDGDEQRIAKLHSKAFIDPNITALYYIYSRSGVVINNECLACSA
jgi:ribonucleoside-diphosphate reductase alpha chain